MAKPLETPAATEATERTNDRWMTLIDASVYLQTKSSTLTWHASHGNLECDRRSGTLYFKKSVLDAWRAAQEERAALPNPATEPLHAAPLIVEAAKPAPDAAPKPAPTPPPAVREEVARYHRLVDYLHGLPGARTIARLHEQPRTWRAAVLMEDGTTADLYVSLEPEGSFQSEPWGA